MFSFEVKKHAELKASVFLEELFKYLLCATFSSSSNHGVEFQNKKTWLQVKILNFPLRESFVSLGCGNLNARGFVRILDKFW